MKYKKSENRIEGLSVEQHTTLVIHARHDINFYYTKQGYMGLG